MVIRVSVSLNFCPIAETVMQSLGSGRSQTSPWWSFPLHQSGKPQVPLGALARERWVPLSGKKKDIKNVRGSSHERYVQELLWNHWIPQIHLDSQRSLGFLLSQHLCHSSSFLGKELICSTRGGTRLLFCSSNVRQRYSSFTIFFKTPQISPQFLRNLIEYSERTYARAAVLCYVTAVRQDRNQKSILVLFPSWIHTHVHTGTFRRFHQNPQTCPSYPSSCPNRALLKQKRLFAHNTSVLKNTRKSQIN